MKRKHNQTAPTEKWGYLNRKGNHDWWTSFSVLKATEGGMGLSMAMAMLRNANIPCRRADSPYIGHVGVEVPERYARRASRVLFGSSLGVSVNSKRRKH